MSNTLEKFELLSDRGNLEITWSELENLYKFSSLQNGGYDEGVITNPEKIFNK